MFYNYNEINKRIIEIKKQLAEIAVKEKQFPEGKLICAKNDGRYKWYVTNDKKPIYLSKKERKLAEQLAIKKYYESRKHELVSELKACETYVLRAKKYKVSESDKVIEHEEYQRLIGGRVRNVNKEVKKWAEAEYERNSGYKENLIVRATNGKYVRSKSEAIIDKVLYRQGIPFRYEDKLVLGNAVMYPDFTIRHPDTGKEYCWEHFGMMDNAEYVEHACRKIKQYCDNGIVPSVNLIMTYETKEYPFSIEEAEQIVGKYFSA